MVTDISGKEKFSISNTGNINLNADTITLNATKDLQIKSGNFTVDSSGNVDIKGSITATSLTLGQGVSIGYGSISGKPDLTVYITKKGEIPVIGTNPGDNATGFKVDANGLLTASNAVIYGTIYSGAGTIGGWSINNSGISKDTSTYTVHVLPGTNSNKDYLVVHDKATNTYPFFVRADGTLNATKATITGDITAKKLVATETGQIASWNFDKTSLYKTVSGTGTGFQSADSMYFGNSGLSIRDAFYVKSDGTMFANKATIEGTIRATNIKVQNSLYMYGTDPNTSMRTLTIGKTEKNADRLIIGSDKVPSIYIADMAEFETTDEDSTFTVYRKNISDGDALFCVNKLDIQLNAPASFNDTADFFHNLNCMSNVYIDGGLYTLDAYNRPSNSSTVNARLCDPGDNGYSRIAKVASSSVRYKDLISTLTADDVENLYDIPTHWFKYKENYLEKTDERYNIPIPGFVVEDIEKVMPIAIDHNPDGSPEMWNSNIIVPLMFEMIKSNRATIKELEERIKTLEQIA